MKTFLGATLGALMLAGTAMAATTNSSANQASVAFNYPDGTPVTTSVGGTSNGFAIAAPVEDSTMQLVNRTGGGR